LGIDVTRKKFTEMTATINEAIRGQRPEMTIEQVALGFLQVANINMSKPIRALTDSRGFDTTAHNLASFGGAGGRESTQLSNTQVELHTDSKHRACLRHRTGSRDLTSGHS
jgi:5-oxoprolinase (ATP-hydrolysing)